MLARAGHVRRDMGADSLDDDPRGGGHLMGCVVLAEEVDDRPVTFGQTQTFRFRQGRRDRRLPVLEIGQMALLVDLELPSGDLHG